MTPDHQCEEVVSCIPLAVAEKKFSEFRTRWIKRLEARSDDWALKTKLLESLEDAYLAPVGVISDKDFIIINIIISSTCAEVQFSGLGPDQDQCPNMVPKKARFASQVPKLFD